MADEKPASATVTLPREVVEYVLSELQEKHDYPRSIDQFEKCDGCGWCDDMIPKLRAALAAEEGAEMKRCWPWRHEWVEVERWEIMFYPHLFTFVKYPTWSITDRCQVCGGTRLRTKLKETR